MAAFAKTFPMVALLFCFLALTCHDAEAQFADAAPSEATASGDAAGDQSSTLLTAEELNAVVAPVALYPDELLAIVLPASTNPIQVVEAQRFLDKRAKDPNLQPDQEWDPSVLALINYPEVVKKLSDDISWCQDLGNAVLDQQDDVLQAIQTARGSASDAGYLESNDQVTVVNEGDNITVESADPEVIYVPQYDPAPVVHNTYTSYPPPYYSNPYPPYWAPAATFFTGMVVGAAFSYGFDWDNGDIDIDNDINIDNSRGDTNISRGDTSVGSGNRAEQRGDKTQAQNRFNGERKAGNTDKMKWSGQKARQKSSATRKTPAAKRPSSANLQQQLGQGGSGQLQGNQKLKNNAAASNQSNRGNQSLKQNNKSAKQVRQNNAGKQQVRNQQQRQKPQQQRQMQQKPNKGGGAFAGQGNQRVKQQSARGNKSMNRSGGGGGRPPRASGGRR
jgi:Protein of unknown function (DUF3300)